MYDLQYDHTLMASERVTVSLPAELVEGIDRRERNRSRFIAEAVRRELKRRRREDLKRSLESPHPESSELAEAGLDDWAARLPAERASDLLDLRAGRPVRWVPGRGWTARK
jgi:Arc/MetJ-type ribon-helix-helix transcriptional regulator